MTSFSDFLVKEMSKQTAVRKWTFLSKEKPVHPGVLFKEMFITGKGVNITQLCKSLGCPSQCTLSENLAGKRPLGMKMAVRFASYSGETILYWYQMQVNLDVWELEHKLISGNLKVRINSNG